MDVITVESKAFKELEAKINAIADYVLNKQEADNINEDEIWVDSYEVCTFFQFFDTFKKFIISDNHLSHQDKCPHNRYIYIYCCLASQYRRKHCYTLFRENHWADRTVF